MRKLKAIGFVLAAVLAAMSAPAQVQPGDKPVLKAGDPAPAFKVRQWMQGTPIAELEQGQVYVLEFWATWCGPCIAAMPHLSELSKKYEGRATIIGVDVWESRHYPNSDPVELVDRFMKKNPGRMTYRVAVDDGDFMGNHWLKAAGLDGIPASFIVDREGRIAWIGHPHYIEPVLEQVVAGTFDLAAHEAQEKAKREAAESADAASLAIVRPVEEAFKAGQYEKVLELVEKVEQEHPDLALRVVIPKFQAMVAMKNDSAIQDALRKGGRLVDALAVWVVEADGLQPDTYRAAARFLDDLPRVPGAKVTNLLEYSARASLKAGDYDKAIESARQAVELGRQEDLLESQIKTYTDLIEQAEAARAVRETARRQPVSAIRPGDKAPALQVSEWVKGKPIKRFEKGKVYLVEYWATWCGPCIANIPHLTELQKKYGKDGLVVIGMTNPDLDPGYTGQRKENNTLQQARDFVAKRGDGIAYHIAYDTPERTTFKSMMGTRSGIPHAFLFGRDGTLLIDDHPFYLDTAIEKALKGTWDAVSGPADVQRVKDVYWAAQDAKNYADFIANFSILERDYPSMARRLQDLKFNRALKGGQIAPALEAGEQLIVYSRETQQADTLARTVLTAARDLVSLKRGTFSGFVPEDQSQALAQLLEQMAGAASELDGTSYQPYAARAELAFLAGDARRAVELQKLALERVPERSRDVEQRRADEYANAVATRERLERLRRQAQDG